MSQAKESWVPNNFLDPEKEHILVQMWQLFLESEEFARYKEEIPKFNAGDDPDKLFLRFLRARKYDPERGFRMLARAIEWRIEFGVADIKEEEFNGKDLFESGKFYFHKTCKSGRPIGVIHVKLHDPKANEVKALERFTIFQMETGRKLLQNGQEKSTLIFDLSGFSLANMDLHSVQFLVKCFEAYYPESLGVCLIVNAPFIFWTCWKVITPLLDPVVKAKIFFVNPSQLPEYIDEESIPTSLNGKSKFDYEYILPQPVKIDNPKEKEDIINRRIAAFTEFLEVTTKLIEQWKLDEAKQTDEVYQLLKRRNELKNDIRETWYDLQKFESKTIYHRMGVVSDDNRVIDWSKLRK